MTDVAKENTTDVAKENTTDVAKENTTDVPEKMTNVPEKMTNDQYKTYKTAISKLPAIPKITTEDMKTAISCLPSNPHGVDMSNGTMIAKTKLITESGYGRLEKIISYFYNCYNKQVSDDYYIMDKITYPAFKDTDFGGIFEQCGKNPECGILEDKFFNCLKEEAQKDNISAIRSSQFLEIMCNQETGAGKAYLSAKCNSDINHSSHLDFCLKIDMICWLNVELIHNSTQEVVSSN